MKLSDQLALSFTNLMLHKIRSILTSLGIIFGVQSLLELVYGGPKSWESRERA